MGMMMEAGAACRYLEDTDSHSNTSNRDEIPLDPLLPCPEAASLVDNIGIVLPLEVSETRLTGLLVIIYLRRIPSSRRSRTACS